LLRRSGVTAAATLTLLVAGCGGEPPLPAAEYFPTVEAELARLDRATKDLTDRFAAELESELNELLAAADPEAPAAPDSLLADAVAIARSKMQAIIAAQGEQVEVFTSRIGELEPPRAVGSGHNELIAAFTAWESSGADTVVALAGATDLESLALALRASPFADAQFRVDEACRALVDNAAGVGVELTCPGTQLQVLEVAP
jgi:hypothetical protein